VTQVFACGFAKHILFYLVSSDKQTGSQALHTAVLALDTLLVSAVLPGKCVLHSLSCANCTESELVSAPAIRQIK